MQSQFDRLVDILRQNGYTVTVQETVCGKFACVTGNGIYAGFNDHCGNSTHVPDCLNGRITHVPDCLNGRICADNENTFDKWSRCYISLPLPANNGNVAFLLKILSFLGTEDGEVESDYNVMQYTLYPNPVKEIK